MFPSKNAAFKMEHGGEVELIECDEGSVTSSVGYTCRAMNDVLFVPIKGGKLLVKGRILDVEILCAFDVRKCVLCGCPNIEDHGVFFLQKGQKLGWRQVMESQ